MIVGVFGLFRLKPEERVQAGVALVVIVLLNALFIWRSIGRSLSTSCTWRAMIH